MRKKNIFIFPGAAVLIIASAFVGETSPKYATSIYYSNGVACSILLFSVNHFYGAMPGMQQAAVKSVNGRFYKLWTNSTCSHPAYFIP